MLLLLACSPTTIDVQDDLPVGESGTFSLSFAHNDVTRESVVHVPEGIQAGAPVLLNFHGFGGNGLGHMEWADFRELADAQGFIVAYPTGTLLDGSPHWNAALDAPDNKSSADDIGFARKLVETIDAAYSVDLEQVYAVGYSNGGMMAYALACHDPELVAGVGGVSATFLNSETCEATDPVPVIIWHGTDDGVLPYSGDGDSMAAVETAEWWAAHNQAEEQDTATSGDLTRRSWTGDADVVLYTVDGGDHVWFNQPFEGTPTNQVIWEFFRP